MSFRAQPRNLRRSSLTHARCADATPVPSSVNRCPFSRAVAPVATRMQKLLRKLTVSQCRRGGFETALPPSERHPTPLPSSPRTSFPSSPRTPMRGRNPAPSSRLAGESRFPRWGAWVVRNSHPTGTTPLSVPFVPGHIHHPRLRPATALTSASPGGDPCARSSCNPSPRSVPVNSLSLDGRGLG